MGNIIRGETTEDGINPERALLTVRAAGAFKSKVNNAKRKTVADEIEEIIEWKFRRNNTANNGQQPGRITTASDVQVQTLEDTDDTEVLKFVRRYVQCRKPQCTNSL